MSNIESIIISDEYMDMCDIEVEDVHCYYGNGIVTHNSAQEIRITTNISRESVWMKALTSGGDVHKSCYSLDTEILTPEGWKTYDNIGVDDLIAEYNDDINRIEWVKAGHIYWNESDVMYHFWGRNTDLMVTPNHRMWTRGRDNWYIHRADKLAKRKTFDTICSPMLPEKMSTYDSFIEIEPTYHREGYTIKLEDFVELLGYVITDGGTCLRSSRQKEVYFGQSEVKSHVLKKMQELNTRLNNLFKETVDYINGKEIIICGKKATNNGDFHRFSVFSSKLFDFIISIIGGPLKKDRKLSNWVFGLSDELQEIFVRAMIDGDGGYDGNGKDKTRSGCLYIPSDTLCDQIQIIMMGLGYSTHISKIQYETGTTMNRLFFCRDRRVVCVKNEFTEIIKYDKPVKSFCFSVPSGLLVVRRDGKISVCGNTAEKLWGKENYNKDLRKRAKGCFSVNSLLYTSNGAERCLDIQQGTLLDLDGNEQEFGYVIEDRDGYEIELSNGMTFEVTKDHKFLVLDSFDKRWITADEVTEGTQLGIKPMERFGDYQTVCFEGDFKNDAKFVKFDEDLAYLCGLYLGDGYVQPDHNYFSIVVKGDNLDYVEDILARYGNPRISDMDKSKDWYVLVVSKKQFCDWIANTFGVKKDKHINDLVYKSPKSVMMSFLAGMMDSDSKIMGSIEYQSTVKSLCNDFGILASFLGYTMLSINENHSKWKGKTVNYYVARMAYEEKVKEIPIRLSKSIKDLNNRKTSFIGYSILESEREKFKQFGTYKDRGNFTDGRARRLARGISEKIGDWRYEYTPVEVKSKKEKKIKAFIMECKTHYFVGNGIISRNCNFGIIYGMGAPSLVDEKYGIHTLEQAQEFFEQYKNALPELFQWIDRVQRRARRNGTVYTYFGRPRRVKGYYDAGNAGFANRTAVNTQIQGCHLYHNLVLTDKGYKQIGRLYDEFESIHEDMNKWDYRVWNGFEMCDFFPVERGKDVKYRLHFSNGAVVECDSRHKVKVLEKEGIYKWVDVNDLVEGKDYVCFQKGITYQCTKNEDGSVVEDYTYHIITRVEKTDEEVQTYTLCVLNYLHQYVCEEMISKNTAGDILKIVMCRLWDNLLNNPKYKDDVRFMITIHDEIGYSVKASRAHEIMDQIEKNQTIVLKEWPVPIITEASCGWSVGGLFAFEKVKDDNPLGFKYYPKLD